MSIIRNVVPPDGALESSNVNRRSQAIDELKRQASMEIDVITQQPCKETRVRMYTNGDGISEPQICGTLIESDEEDNNEVSSESGFDSV